MGTSTKHGYQAKRPFMVDAILEGAYPTVKTGKTELSAMLPGKKKIMVWKNFCWKNPRNMLCV